MREVAEKKEVVKISALVASNNEGHFLEDCLKSLQFCDEVILLNFKSNDNTVQIGKKYVDKIIDVDLVPFIEKLFPIFIPQLKHDWFILLDPDERITEKLQNQIIEFVSKPIPNTSRVTVPMYNLFCGKPLKSLKANTTQRLLYYKPGINVSDQVHKAFTTKPGYNKYHISLHENNFILHFWCNSWAQLKDKHTRYAMGEGKVLYQEGKRFSWFKLIVQTIQTFFYAFIKQEYYKDGKTGIKFSYHEGRYSYLSWMSLRKYQVELKKAGKLQSPKQVAMEQMQQKVQQFVAETEQIISSYNQAKDTNLKAQIIQQYQKSLHRIVNDALEINAFELAEKAMNAASFNDEMKTYLVSGLLLNRLKLIQNSGSYRLVRAILKKSKTKG